MDDEHMRQRLTEERERLDGIRNELDGLRRESQEDGLQELSSYDQHQADVGTETFDREKDLSILQEVEGELADIEHALQRLDDGTYGTCEACGKPISDDRLEALPATRFCLEDQAQAERESRTASSSGAEE
ncbi:MAG: TraR/DksA C4-type zinc finger protein [Actinobacteria bacterium]|nr:TraR/DksA C4-type zinc finger protein [Actinomycetota bacterium]